MTINPPPAGSGLAGATGISPSVSVKSVTVEPRDPNPRANASLVVETTIQEEVGNAEVMRWYDRANYTNYLRMRVVLSLSRNASRTLDFIQQRLNQYHGGVFPNNAFDSNGAFLNALRNPNFGTNVVLNFGGPYDTVQLTRTIKNQESNIYYLKNVDHLSDTVFKDVIVYDAPLANHLQRDQNENVLRRRTATVTQGRYVLEEMPLRDVVFTMGSENEEYPSLDLSQVSIYCFTYFDRHQWEEDNNLPVTPDLLNISFGFVFPTVVRGDKFVYDNIVPQSTFISDDEYRTFNINGDEQRRSRMGEQDRLQAGTDLEDLNLAPGTPRIITAPDQDLFQNLLLSQLPDAHTIKKRLYENFYNSLSTSIVGKGFADSISSQNFYSPLWITKDNGKEAQSFGIQMLVDFDSRPSDNDNARYCFAFDKRSFLVENSRFPLMYIMPNISYELFNGGEYIHTADSSPDGVDERSGIIDRKMLRRSFEFDAFAADNNLTTILKTKIINPDYYYPEVVIDTPRRSPLLSLPADGQELNRFDGAVEFYEGRDSFSLDTQTMGRYQYGAQFLLKDSSVLYIVRVAEKLRRMENQTIEIFNLIVNSVPIEEEIDPWSPHGAGHRLRPPEPLPPRRGRIIDGRGLFNYNTRSRVVTLENIGVENTSAQARLYSIIDNYLAILTNFGVTTNQTRQQIQETLRGLVQSSDPEGINELAKSINVLAFILEGIAGEEMPGFSTRDQNLQKSVLEQRGYCQRKLVLLESKHYFDSYFDYGKEFKLGYNYLLEDDGSQTNGLIRISPEGYKSRAIQEFYKYFDFYRDSDVPQEARQQAPFDSRFVNSTLTYFSPLTIKTHGKSPVIQPEYKNQNSNFLDYDLNRYGELFTDIVKTKYNTLYLNHPFYQLYDSQGQEPHNLKLYHSLQDDLTHHYCHVEEDPTVQANFPIPEKSFSIPKTTVNKVPDQNPLKPQRVLQEGLSAINLTVGGETNVSAQWDSAQDAFIDGVTTDAQNKDAPPIVTDDPNPPQQKNPVGLPIKLLFSILGEMEINPSEIGSNRNYLEDRFNSFVESARSLGLNANNIQNAIENNLQSLPNQFKAMLTIAATNERRSFAAGFDAVRFELEDRDVLDQEGRNIGAIYDSNPWPPYVLTSDAMKIYSKFLAFWMNYKQVAVVEYLSGFGYATYGNIFEDYVALVSGLPREDVTRPKVKLPQWKKFTGAEFASFFGERNTKNLRLLCRIRALSEEDYATQRGPKGEMLGGIEKLPVEQEDLFDLPVYNKYFVLENSNSTNFNLGVGPFTVNANDLPEGDSLRPAPVTVESTPPAAEAAFLGGAVGAVGTDSSERNNSFTFSPGLVQNNQVQVTTVQQQGFNVGRNIY